MSAPSQIETYPGKVGGRLNREGQGGTQVAPPHLSIALNRKTQEFTGDDEELDELILRGWGGTLRHNIPANWRQKLGPDRAGAESFRRGRAARALGIPLKSVMNKLQRAERRKLYLLETNRPADQPAREYWHGTANGYSNRKCRCAACRQANTESCRKWMNRPNHQAEARA